MGATGGVQNTSAPRGVPLQRGDPGIPISTIRCCSVVRNTVAPASALVTVTVLAAGGVINRPGDAVVDGMTMSLQSGSGTAGTDWVGLGVRAVLLACAHPATNVTTATPTSVDRSMDAMYLTVSTLPAGAWFLETTHLQPFQGT